MGWIGVDLDRTLAEYESGYFHKYGRLHIGKPIPAMVERVKGFLREGKEVRILTARVEFDDMIGEGTEEGNEVIEAIGDWCLQHVGERLFVTCIKDWEMETLYDDRAIEVIPNTGLTLQEHLDNIEFLKGAKF